ncbi:UxaA family hydrolase [Fodinisporobacter ferrooxydans]|uniref:UxaA family hydrolase n=1 Tax=Fodinisporobacter ferrooxydans TaxID=2901836 RepID=A0ABY4CM85_9BACL|nr:UxaA family hydrolase [Alicyclobacillaceae bacterium MYW30-H2]
MQKESLQVAALDQQPSGAEVQTHKFLIHKKGDHVGVVTEDISQGETVIGFYMDDDSMVEVIAKADIPLGHKISVVHLQAGDAVIEYGLRVGLAREAIEPGDYVHVHNIKSARW